MAVHQGTHQHSTQILKLFRKTELYAWTFRLNDIKVVGVEEQG